MTSHSPHDTGGAVEIDVDSHTLIQPPFGPFIDRSIIYYGVSALVGFENRFNLNAQHIVLNIGLTS